MPATQNAHRNSQTSASDLGCFLDCLDLRLRHVWDDLSDFVQAANTVAQCELNIDSEMYQKAVVSIHYRLVNLRFDTGNVHETIRLALLAFASTLFLQWCGVKIRYEYLTQHLMIALSLLKHMPKAMPTNFTLWLHIVGAISVFDGQERARLRPAQVEVLRAMKLKSWDEVRLSLQSVLWLNVLHDSPAKQMVDALLSEP